MSRRIITIDDLKRDHGLAQVIEDLTKRFNGELPEAVVDSMIDTAAWADTIPKQVAQWIGDTVEVTNRILSNKANSSDFSICWIRIFEIIGNLPAYFSRYETLYPEIQKIKDEGMKRHIELGEKIRKHILELEAALSEDEIVTIEYERNCNAHIFQNGYRFQVKIPANTNIVRAKTEYKGKSIKDVNAAIEREMIKYKYVDANFLRAVLKKIQPHLDSIAPVLKTWSK